ncbi:MAG: hypothetical protein Q7K37_06530, partial [Dehalococcoidia bacterium]|nr:hypothetical protein [Dehalococcoidia bacterium]
LLTHILPAYLDNAPKDISADELLQIGVMNTTRYLDPFVAALKNEKFVLSGWPELQADPSMRRALAKTLEEHGSKRALADFRGLQNRLETIDRLHRLIGDTATSVKAGEPSTAQRIEWLIDHDFPESDESQYAQEARLIRSSLAEMKAAGVSLNSRSEMMTWLNSNAHEDRVREVLAYVTAVYHWTIAASLGADNAAITGWCDPNDPGLTTALYLAEDCALDPRLGHDETRATEADARPDDSWRGMRLRLTAPRTAAQTLKRVDWKEAWEIVRSGQWQRTVRELRHALAQTSGDVPRLDVEEALARHIENLAYMINGRLGRASVRGSLFGWARDAAGIAGVPLTLEWYFGDVLPGLSEAAGIAVPVGLAARSAVGMSHLIGRGSIEGALTKSIHVDAA